MRVSILLHAPFEGSGAIGTWARRRGEEVHEVHLYRGERVQENCDLLVLMGGPMDPSDVKEYPFLEEAMEAIRRAKQSGGRVLGVCLGAQLIGAALGAPVERSPEREVGLFSVELTEEGLRDPLSASFGTIFPALHWHGMMAGLPKEATVLAATAGCPRQMIRFAQGIFGLQFHLELTQESVQSLIDHAPEDLAIGRYVQSRQELLAAPFAAMHHSLHNFLELLCNE